MAWKADNWKLWTGWARLEAQWLRRKHFTASALERIAQRIADSERGHAGELMVAIEATSPGHERDTHLRALEVFGRLRVWDTPLNTGILLYLALDRHRIEIIADRGIAAPSHLWEQVCSRLQASLQQRDYVGGVLAAVEQIEAILATRCPAQAEALARNDLPDEPVVL